MNNFVKFSKNFSRFAPTLVIFASDFQRLLHYFKSFCILGITFFIPSYRISDLHPSRT